MTVRLHFVAAILLLTFAVPALAEEVRATERATKELPIYLGGTFVLQNIAGDVDLIGTDDARVVIAMEKTVRGIDKPSLDEGMQKTIVQVAGDESMRIVQTFVPPLPMRSGKWGSAVNFNIRVPRTVHVKIVSMASTRIHISDIRGNVAVKGFNGTIMLDGVTGPSAIESVNGNIVFNAPQRGLANAHLTSINGSIEVHAPMDASFQWAGDTTKGDARTTFPGRFTFSGTSFKGSINAPGGPIITTQSLMGNVAVLRYGTQYANSRSIRDLAPLDVFPVTIGTVLPRVAKTIHTDSVQGVFIFSTLIGNVSVGEVRGNAKITTGAGEVQLGTVYGDCQVISNGGPLNLGEMLGSVSARTEAGDVLVQAARNGGTIITGGGTIRLLYTAGPTRLQSGGGDIVVRQAAAPINAETQSGDINITVDPGSKTERITAKTAKGNVILNVTPAFGAEIDATVITSDPGVNNIASDLTGLDVRREQIGGKTKIRAIGKVNGGGDRVELYAEDGGIQISTKAGAPISLVSP